MRRFISRSIAFTACVLYLALCCGQETEQAGGGKVKYKLGPNDLILLRISNMPDINDKPIRIDSEGNIKLPMVGRVQASGLTTEELESQLTSSLKTYFEDPEVAVTVSEFHSQPVSVLGAVGTPGVQQLQGHKTLIEVISLAGGLRPDAGPKATITRRRECGVLPLPGAKVDASGEFSTAEVATKPLIEGRQPDLNIPICPQDVISVPPALMVYLIGDVTKTGGLPLNEGDKTSVLQALSAAGGPLKTAAPSKSRILRAVDGSKRRAEIPVDVSRIERGKADDVDLLPGDILVVPGNANRAAYIRAAEAALQIGTMALTYGIIR